VRARASAWWRDRSVRLAAGLAVAIAIPAAVLVFFQHRWLDELEHTSAAVLEGLSQQTADTLHAAIRTEFERPGFEIARLDQLARERLDLDIVAPALEEAFQDSLLVDAVYLWSEQAPDSPASPVLVFPTGGAPPDPLRPGSRFRPAGLEATLLKEHAATFASHRVSWGTFLHEAEGARQVFVVHLLFDSAARRRLTSFLGVRVGVDRLGEAFLPRLVRPHMQAASGRTGLATLVAAVVDQDGRVLFDGGEPEGVRHFLDERVVPLLFFSPYLVPSEVPCEPCLGELRLRVGYGDQTIERIVGAQTLGNRVLLFTLVGVLAVGALVFASAAAHEMRLAEAKAVFVAKVSHELKTPLALIQLFAETLALGRVRSRERAHEYYQIIHSEARKLTGLIDNVLDFSRIETGFWSYRLVELDLLALVQGVLAKHRPDFERRGMEVSLSGPDEVPTVLADAEAVELAFGNLVSNAVKYSGDSRAIEVSLAADAAHVAIRVLDHGIGIPRRLQRRIFERFYRIEEGEGGERRGWGLGLAIVDQVMRAHRGRVLVDSEPGRGSTFTLVFPRPKESMAREQANTRDRRRAPDAAGAA
jgi:signal transduction histidine kinase